MELHQLPKSKKRGKRRLGQGHGTGRVKTAGRGTKGQKARGRISLSFEGGAVSLIKRLPFRRGKGKNKPFNRAPVVVNVKSLNLLPKNTVVTVESLIKHNIVDKNDATYYGVKILGDGDIMMPLTIKLPISKSASEKIVKAGGTIEI